MTHSIKSIDCIFSMVKPVLIVSILLHAKITARSQNTNYSENEIFSTWNTTVQQQDKDDFNNPKEKNEKKQIQDTISFKTLYILDKAFSIPTNYTEDGIDVFMLTEEGITIHMAALQPIFWQETTPDLIKWIRFYAHGKREYTKKIFSKYERWEPYVRACFKAHNVPEDIAILCLVESGCSYEAVSSAGAIGMWQIMKETGKEWGLTINEKQDDRLDPVLSSAAAAKILSNNYSLCNDWTLAIAAYNCGIGRVGKCIKNAGVNHWPECKPYMPSETQEYIPALLAIHYVWNYRKELGFNYSGQP